MKRRFKRYISYLFIKYTPGASKIAHIESKRIAEYIFNNFSAKEQNLLVKEIKENLITLKEGQVESLILEIDKSKNLLKSLENNLNKLKSNEKI